MLFPTPNPRLLSDKQSSWVAEEQEHRQAETWALGPAHPGDIVPSWSTLQLSEKRSSLGLLKRLAGGRQMETWGSLNKQFWSTRNIELCCGWEIWKNIPPYPFPSPSSLSLPPKSMRGKNYSAPIHSVVLLLSVIGNASEGNDIHRVMKGEHKNIHQQLWNAAASTAEPGGSRIEHSNTTQET